MRLCCRKGGRRGPRGVGRREKLWEEPQEVGDRPGAGGRALTKTAQLEGTRGWAAEVGGGRGERETRSAEEPGSQERVGGVGRCGNKYITRYLLFIPGKTSNGTSLPEGPQGDSFYNKRRSVWGLEQTQKELEGGRDTGVSTCRELSEGVDRDEAPPSSLAIRKW